MSVKPALDENPAKQPRLAPDWKTRRIFRITLGLSPSEHLILQVVKQNLRCIIEFSRKRLKVSPHYRRIGTSPAGHSYIQNRLRLGPILTVRFSTLSPSQLPLSFDTWLTLSNLHNLFAVNNFERRPLEHFDTLSINRGSFVGTGRARTAHGSKPATTLSNMNIQSIQKFQSRRCTPSTLDPLPGLPEKVMFSCSKFQRSRFNVSGVPLVKPSQAW